MLGFRDGQQYPLISSPETSSIDSPPPPSEPQNLNNFFPGKFQFFYYMRDTYNYLNKHYSAGDIITKKRNRLGLSTAPLLLVKSWMGLPEVEDWEVQQEKEDEDLEVNI